MAIDGEEDLLRSVALRNANAILLARQRNERELARERELLRITLASIGDAVISTDAEGRVTFLNGVAETLTGWTLADASGRPLSQIFHIVNEATRRPVENPAILALRKGSTVGMANHTILIARDGSERPIEDSAAPIRDGSGPPVGAVLIFRDVTERKRAEETQARLAAIVESSEDAIISKSLTGIIQTWNAGAERLFGYTADEAIGKSINLIIPAERIDEENSIFNRLIGGNRIASIETVRITKWGQTVEISLTVSPIRNSDGAVIGASKVSRDITERKRDEERLREADRKKDEFIALLAHELRNPLAPMRNALQALRQSDDRKVLERCREIMERQLTHMVRLVDDLLDISRLNRNMVELRRERVSLADILDSAVETARPLIDSSKHDLQISLPAEPIFLDADLTRLSQVFSNLLINSAKYTEPGGRIRVVADRQNSIVAVSVRDSGMGIPADEMCHLFEMFTRVDRSIERSQGGLGIGLALVKGLVEMHGGTVSAESAGVGRGSTFRVVLPVSVGAAEIPAVSTTDGVCHAPGRRILVVDDNRDSAITMAMMLEILGDEVRTAHDGIDAVQVAGDFRPEVVLMDIGMPRMNGYEATRRIREQKWGKEMAIIALTGWGQEGDRALSKAAGCNGHLVKPVSLPELEKALGELAR